MYQVAKNKIVLHSKEQKHYYEGQEIDLSHLSDEQIRILLEAGVIVKIEDKPKEKKNG